MSGYPDSPALSDNGISNLLERNAELERENSSLKAEIEELRRAGAVSKVDTNEALRQGNLLQAILDNIPIFLVIWDAHLQQFRFNKAFRSASGWSEEDTLDGNFMAKVYPDPEYRGEVEQFMQSLQPGFRDLRTTFRDGSVVDIAWANVRIPGGTTLGIGVDISERKRGEEATRRYWKLLETIMDQLPVAVNIVREEGLRMIYVNPAYRMIAPGKDMVGYSIREVWPEARQHLEPVFLNVLKTGEPYSEKDQLYHIRRASEGEPEPAYFSWSLFRIGLPDGSRGLLNFAWETTDRRMMEDELKRAKDELENRVQERTEELRKAYDQLVVESIQRRQAEDQLLHSQKMEAVGTLAGGIAHDFNNMLAAVIGLAEMALSEIEDGGNGRLEIEQIISVSKRAGELIKQILTFSRRSETRRKPVKLGSIVEETVKLLRASLPRAIRIKLRISAKQDTILADPSQIQQVLINLATNAAFAMTGSGNEDESSAVLTICVSEVACPAGEPIPDSGMAPGRYLKLEVSDTGRGMSQEVKKRIFDPFFTTKGPGEGTGMGLAVVFGIVKSLDGGITVMSKPGEGSTFSVFLPASEEQMEEGACQKSLPHGGTEHVMVVDDEPLVRETVARRLKRLGYKVTAAGTGLEALRLFESAPDDFDLVITDHVMPEITGLRLAEKMLEMRDDLCVILYTGYSETVSPEKAKAAGISEFLMKPLGANDLTATVRRLLDERNLSKGD